MLHLSIVLIQVCNIENLPLETLEEIRRERSIKFNALKSIGPYPFY